MVFKVVLPLTSIHMQEAEANKCNKIVNSKEKFKLRVLLQGGTLPSSLVSLLPLLSPFHLFFLS
jgi:hypothetical protein